MSILKRAAAVLFLTGLSLVGTHAQIAPNALREWRDQKYSLFIHFGGIYSVLGGVWNDKPVTVGLSEQIQAHAGIYSDTYAKVARRFNPTRWNADSIASLAKRAGMHSVVITSKHHDGFCMFKTATTDFNVVDATPYGRDIIRELSDACRRNGTSFGLYFSLIDWHYPQASPISSHNSDPITSEHHDYNKRQITELLTSYGPISELWFDMGSMSEAQSREMRDLVHKLQPNCLIGSRIGNDMGDFTVMGDNQEPDYTIGVPWQSPASFFDETWGYRSWQKRVPESDKAREKLTSLIRVVSRGGKYLLNIGPKGDGSVVPYERDVLLHIGQWLTKNGEAIYGASADPFHQSFAWGSVTSRPGKLYLHLMKQPAGNQIALPGLSGAIKQVSVLGEPGVILTTVRGKDGLGISLPAGFVSGNGIRVVTVEFTDGYRVRPYNPISLTDTTRLTHANSYKHYSNSGVDYNSRFQSIIAESWTVQVEQGGTHRPLLLFSDEEKGQSIDLTINGTTQTVKLSGDSPAELDVDPATLAWGPLYKLGPVQSGIEGTPGRNSLIDLKKPVQGQSWQRMTDWKNGPAYTLPADLTTAYYITQTITAPTDRRVLVRITSGDGVLVMLNGQTLLLRNNPAKANNQRDVVLLPLKKGINQLLVKTFSNFQKTTPVSIDYGVPQLLYQQDLRPVTLPSGTTSVQWQAHDPVSPHRTLVLPNLSLRLLR